MRATLAMHVTAGALALGGCGSGSPGQPMVQHDGGPLDSAPIPPPPVLGTQLARMGRPLTTTALIGVLQPAQTQAAMRVAYNQASDPAAWASTTIGGPNGMIGAEIAANLAVFDAWDIGFAKVAKPGCGNPLGGLAPDVYSMPTALFSDDQLYIDTFQPSCTTYLALEIEVANRVQAHTQCGGRMPSHDVVDMTYSVLAAGLQGLAAPSSNYAPTIPDGVAAHTDLKETVFPFLGPPHP